MRNEERSDQMTGVKLGTRPGPKPTRTRTAPGTFVVPPYETSQGDPRRVLQISIPGAEPSGESLDDAK
jgi:hypothetical protein